jgi:hypothetical protein
MLLIQSRSAILQATATRSRYKYSLNLLATMVFIYPSDLPLDLRKIKKND